MAYETARLTGDSEWSKNVAAPVIFASATFYASIVSREIDGSWGIRIKPSSGQDELGGRDAPNYLCALFSAKYCLQTALTIANEWGIAHANSENWKAILDDGLAFQSLLDPDLGIYSTNGAVSAAEVAGHQKHPVQLAPLTFLPLGAVDEPTATAYRHREALCEQNGEQTKLWGWTLPAYWLAAARQGDSDGLRRELQRGVSIENVDPDWIQIFESSGCWFPFFITSHGLYLQAVQDAFASDFNGRLTLRAAVPTSWADAEFYRLRTIFGAYSSRH